MRACHGLSETEAPTSVGSGVIAEDFIFAEGASVEDGVVLHTGFVGQGVQLGKQFSAENSLFFANSEAFHGEACAVFAGPMPFKLVNSAAVRVAKARKLP